MKTSPECLRICGFANANRVAGAELLGLLDKRDALILAEQFDDFILAMPNHNNHMLHPGVVARIKDVTQHRLATHLMQRFRPLALEACALSSCENDCRR